MKVPSTFQLTLSVKDHSNGKHVVFKNDGQRFENGSEKTVKFYTDSVYDVDVSTKPALELSSITFLNNEVSLSPKPADNKVYEGFWKTDGKVAHTRGSRENLTLLISGVFGRCTIPLQVKFYKPGSSKGTCGLEVKSITWKCVITDDGTVLVSDCNYL